jgi:hypothetical protein
VLCPLVFSKFSVTGGYLNNSRREMTMRTVQKKLWLVKNTRRMQNLDPSPAPYGFYTGPMSCMTSIFFRLFSSRILLRCCLPS